MIKTEVSSLKKNSKTSGAKPRKSSTTNSKAKPKQSSAPKPKTTEQKTNPRLKVNPKETQKPKVTKKSVTNATKLKPKPKSTVALKNNDPVTLHGGAPFFNGLRSRRAKVGILPKGQVEIDNNMDGFMNIIFREPTADMMRKSDERIKRYYSAELVEKQYDLLFFLYTNGIIDLKNEDDEEIFVYRLLGLKEQLINFVTNNEEFISNECRRSGTNPPLVVIRILQLEALTCVDHSKYYNLERATDNIDKGKPIFVHPISSRRYDSIDLLNDLEDLGKLTLDQFRTMMGIKYLKVENEIPNDIVTYFFGQYINNFYGTYCGMFNKERNITKNQSFNRTVSTVSSYESNGSVDFENS
jgi:hypothetical protein